MNVKNVIKENTVRDRRWRPIVDQECYFRRLFQNEVLFLLKIMLIYDELFWAAHLY